ncbi:MAG: flagellar motor switch protein FliN [Bythopirellula sp.]|nr:flagellar motor switch protein FliN [Bythopirellula sp.]
MADESNNVNQDAIDNLSQAHPSGSSAVDQAEIEALLASGSQTAPVKPSISAKPAASYEGVSQDDIELLLNKAEAALASIDSNKDPLQALPIGMRTFEFEKFRGTSANSDAATLELMRDVQLDMTVELGRTHMHLEDVLQLRKGAVVPLDKLAGDLADIFVNGRLIARGEVLVLNDNFCIRVAELIVGEAA